MAEWAMSKSESYQGLVNCLDPQISKRTSTTYYYGAKGEEIADYSHNYKMFGDGAGTEVKTTSYMYYAGKRVIRLTGDEMINAAMDKNDTYRGEFDQLDALETMRTSTTFFFGDKGDELADYSYSYKLFGDGAGTEIKTTSYMYYTNKRAGALSATEQIFAAMNKNDSYRGEFGIDGGEITLRMSTTFFYGSKGDEIADYSYSYKLFGDGAGTEVKTT
ncbi:MAG: hypothetical protein PHS37_03290, partial [Candidatus Omnitrophica bacterium]|nr:hypothetical protein [Candidatus Omnitrophota bacterium]